MDQRARVGLFAAAALSFALLAACSESPEQRAVREAQAADRDLTFESTWRVKQTMREPDSMETRAVRIAPNLYADQRVVCGQVNARNGFGGMTGFQRFMVLGGVVPMTEPALAEERRFFDQIWAEAGC